MAQLAFSSNGPVPLAPVAKLQRNVAMMTVCSEAADCSLASPLLATRCYMEGMAGEGTRRQASFRCQRVGDITGEGWR
jgi:hypothetical protein